MRQLFCFVVLYSANASAAPNVLMSAAHGDKMSIEYREDETGKRVLVVQEKVGTNGSKAVQKEIQIIDLNLKNGEQVSLNYGFRCTIKGKDFVYGIISKAIAKKNGSFSPLRGWSVDEKNLKLVAQDDPKKINCTWSPEGESEYPF